MHCNICDNKMIVFAKGIKWTYYKCPTCNWFSTLKNKNNMEEINYDTYDTFDRDLEIYDIMVKDAEKILRHKFKIINQLPNSFLDFGCSEGIFVNAFNNITMGRGGGKILRC